MDAMTTVASRTRVLEQSLSWTRLGARLRGGTLLITDDAGESWARLPATLPDVIGLAAATA